MGDIAFPCSVVVTIRLWWRRIQRGVLAGDVVLCIIALEPRRGAWTSKYGGAGVPNKPSRVPGEMRECEQQEDSSDTRANDV